MNWEKLLDTYKNIVGDEDIDVDEDDKKNDDPLKDYNLIDRYNINELEPGMYVKYIKNVIDENDNIVERICGGGFFIKILKGSKFYEMELLLKSTRLWKLKFIKYKIYAKKPATRASIKNNLLDCFKSDIEERRKEIEKRYNMSEQPKKNYNVKFIN
jgi:hypothetical protein